MNRNGDQNSESLTPFTQKRITQTMNVNLTSSSGNLLENILENDQTLYRFLSTSLNVHFVPNNERTNCFRCNIPFSIFKRKHHCRICGEIFCNDCNFNNLIFINNENIQVLLCHNCNEILKNRGIQIKINNNSINKSLQTLLKLKSHRLSEQSPPSYQKSNIQELICQNDNPPLYLESTELFQLYNNYNQREKQKYSTPRLNCIISNLPPIIDVVTSRVHIFNIYNEDILNIRLDSNYVTLLINDKLLIKLVKKDKNNKTYFACYTEGLYNFRMDEIFLSFEMNNDLLVPVIRSFIDFIVDSFLNIETNEEKIRHNHLYLLDNNSYLALNYNIKAVLFYKCNLKKKILSIHNSNNSYYFRILFVFDSEIKFASLFPGKFILDLKGQKGFTYLAKLPLRRNVLEFEPSPPQYTIKKTFENKKINTNKFKFIAAGSVYCYIKNDTLFLSISFKNKSYYIQKLEQLAENKPFGLKSCANHLYRSVMVLDQDKYVIKSFKQDKPAKVTFIPYLILNAIPGKTLGIEDAVENTDTPDVFSHLEIIEHGGIMVNLSYDEYQRLLMELGKKSKFSFFKVLLKHNSFVLRNVTNFKIDFLGNDDTLINYVTKSPDKEINYKNCLILKSFDRVEFYENSYFIQISMKSMIILNKKDEKLNINKEINLESIGSKTAYLVSKIKKYILENQILAKIVRDYIHTLFFKITVKNEEMYKQIYFKVYTYDINIIADLPIELLKIDQKVSDLFKELEIINSDSIEIINELFYVV